MRVLAAMSGGVDSAVAAARAVDAGHDVVGVHLALSREPAGERTGARGCCTVEDAHDARRTADVLGVPFYVWDLSARFATDVVDVFTAEYAAGRTPNPCLLCNQRIKFSALLDRALALGFDAVATGHYARIAPGPDGRPALHRAADRVKDQSYVLSVVPAARLAHALFPLGDAVDKAAVRAEARERGLAVAGKPDSHDICFVPDGDTRGWLARRLPPQRPGPVVDTAGQVLGTHDGAAGHTVGQRRGLRLGTPAPDGRPRYVLDVSVATNTITVGSAEDLGVDRVTGTGPVWCGPPAEPGAVVGVQVRAHGEEVPGTVTEAGERLVVSLHRPLRGVAPGQTAALYDGDRVVGSATVEAAGRDR